MYTPLIVFPWRALPPPRPHPAGRAWRGGAPDSDLWHSTTVATPARVTLQNGTLLTAPIPTDTVSYRCSSSSRPVFLC